MKFQCFYLLVAIVGLHEAVATASTNPNPEQAISIAGDEKDVSTTRLLRSYEEEERGPVDWVKGLINNKNGYVKLKKTNIIAKKTVGGAFTTWKLDKVKSVDEFFSNPKLTQLGNVDDFFTNKNFDTWQSFIFYSNRGSKNQETTVAKSISLNYGDEKAAVLFAAAMKSTNANVKDMGTRFQRDLFKQWIKANPIKKPKEVAKFSEAIAKEYQVVYRKAVKIAKANAAAGEKKFMPPRGPVAN
ncbi:hypothetical protein PHMEG_00034959 [Phytophthora megakarya]|uniref:RxLR effector protein n=1 Tax=Phytophthora megakarya TaxID=4795 RepID=A0A225UQ93_9STRA|nr:hypothetical protein PHMEG_00034959 [Phytophthora megakarya]